MLKVINLVSTDVQRFDSFFPSMHFGWMGVIDMIVISTIICVYVGYKAGLAGCVVMLISITLSTQFAKRFFRLRKLTAQFTDTRVKVLALSLIHI